MKILVDKIEEYRATEDGMRLALLSAQKLGTQIQNEAKENAENHISEEDAFEKKLAKTAFASRAERYSAFPRMRTCTVK